MKAGIQKGQQGRKGAHWVQLIFLGKIRCEEEGGRREDWTQGGPSWGPMEGIFKVLALVSGDGAWLLIRSLETDQNMKITCHEVRIVINLVPCILRPISKQKNKRTGILEDGA